MAQYEREENGNGWSVVGSLINPVSSFKYEFLSGWGLLSTYRTMNQGQLAFQPFVISQLVGAGGKNAVGLGSKMSLKTFGRGMWHGFSIGGADEVASEISTAMGYSGDVATAFQGKIRSELQREIVSNRFKSMTGTQILETFKTLAPETGVTGRIMNTAKLASAANLFKTSMMISRIGAVANPILGAATFVQLASWGTSLAFKGAVSALNYAEATVQHMRNLEMGGTLGPGFMSMAAATERQRAVSELQRSPLAGRRTMGREASMYSAII